MKRCLSSFVWRTKRRDSSTFIRVCERPVGPARPEAVRLLVQIPPAWLKEGRALPGFRHWAERKLDSTESTALVIAQSKEELLRWPLALLDPETGIICRLTFNAPSVSSYHLSGSLDGLWFFATISGLSTKFWVVFFFSTVVWWAILFLWFAA